MNGLDPAREISKNDPTVPIAMYTLRQNLILKNKAQAFGVRKVIAKTEVFSALIPSPTEILARHH